MKEITTPYINLQSDFGFKYVFGSEKNKSALMTFLNVLFAGRLTVTDVIFHDKEILPSEQEGKRIVYDVYCTFPSTRSKSDFFPESQTMDSKGQLETDYHFILEMQNIYTPPFEERIVYYSSKIISEQGKAGWNYELSPVFTIGIIDFNFSHLTPKLVRDIMLVDRESGEPLTDKIHIYFCSLKEVPEKWENCRTDLSQVLFIIKNMDNMDNTSIAYREGRYRDIFNAARSNTLNPEEIVAYSQSLEKLRDTRAGILFAADKARAEGRAEGIAEGMAKGIAEGRAEGRAEGEKNKLKQIVVALRHRGYDDIVIADMLNEPVDAIALID